MPRPNRSLPLAALLAVGAKAQMATSSMVMDPSDTAVTTVTYSTCPSSTGTVTTVTNSGTSTFTGAPQEVTKYVTECQGLCTGGPGCTGGLAPTTYTITATYPYHETTSGGAGPGMKETVVSCPICGPEGSPMTATIMTPMPGATQANPPMAAGPDPMADTPAMPTMTSTMPGSGAPPAGPPAGSPAGPPAGSPAGPPADSPAPGGSTPGGSTPGGSAPGGSTPGGSTPGGSTPGGSTPGGSTPGGSTPGDNKVVNNDNNNNTKGPHNSMPQPPASGPGGPGKPSDPDTGAPMFTGGATAMPLSMGGAALTTVGVSLWALFVFAL